ncbi:MAG TPA: hypothetical protein VF753_14695, partial [Terriglobales bacterium]
SERSESKGAPDNSPAASPPGRRKKYAFSTLPKALALGGARRFEKECSAPLTNETVEKRSAR